MVIDGIWWLVIFLLIFITIYCIARVKKVSDVDNLHQNMSKEIKNVTNSTNIALQKLHKQLVNQLPEYTITLKKNHITIVKAKKRLMMITLDKGKEIGTRKLGGVMILNFHRIPNHKDIQKLL